MTGRRPGAETAIAGHVRAARCAPGTWSTPPGCTPTNRPAPSATTDFTVTPAPGRADRLRQARPRPGRPHPAAGADGDGKGVLVAPTVFGNVMLGPTAEDLDDKPDTVVHRRAGSTPCWRQGRRILPALVDEEVTAVYAGLRAATEHDDYRIRAHPEQRYVAVGGIRSTGLTASMAIAAHVMELLADGGLDPRSRRPRPAPRLSADLGEAFPRPHRGAPSPPTPSTARRLPLRAGHRGESATRSSRPSRHRLDGLRRRTRAGRPLPGLLLRRRPRRHPSGGSRHRRRPKRSLRRRRSTS